MLGAKPAGDRIKTAIGWLAKAWRNTATVHFPERVVFLKTAFEAMTGTSNSYISAQDASGSYSKRFLIDRPRTRNGWSGLWLSQ